MKPDASTRIQLCGRLTVVWQDARVEDRLPSRQGRLLFAYLVVHRQRAVSRDELVDAVWPDDPPAAARSALNALLSKLRGALDRDAVTGTDNPQLNLPGDAFVDLDHARESLHIAESAAAQGDWVRAWAPARAALHTATRGFAPGLQAPWVSDMRRSVEEMRLRALECVAATGVGLGGTELASAERAARTLIEASPLGESGYLHLMRAHAARDNVSEALLLYESLRSRLRDELGIAPSARAQALHAELLRRR